MLKPTSSLAQIQMVPLQDKQWNTGEGVRPIAGSVFTDYQTTSCKISPFHVGMHY